MAGGRADELILAALFRDPGCRVVIPGEWLGAHGLSSRSIIEIGRCFYSSILAGNNLLDILLGIDHIANDIKMTPHKRLYHCQD